MPCLSWSQEKAFVQSVFLARSLPWRRILSFLCFHLFCVSSFPPPLLSSMLSSHSSVKSLTHCFSSRLLLAYNFNIQWGFAGPGFSSECFSPCPRVGFLCTVSFFCSETSVCSSHKNMTLYFSKNSHAPDVCFCVLWFLIIHLCMRVRCVCILAYFPRFLKRCEKSHIALRAFCVSWGSSPFPV